MRKTMKTFTLVIVVTLLVAAGCSGAGPKSPMSGTDLRGLRGAGALSGLAIVVYYEHLDMDQARGIYDKLLQLGMRDTLFEPGLGEGGPRMIMYRAERMKEAQWLKDHVWELKDFGMMLETSATDIYINTW